MKKTFITIQILFFGLYLQAHAQIDSTKQGELSDLLIAQNTDYFIRYSGTKELGNGLVAHLFFYKIRNGDWPYGSGFEISHPGRENPIWFFKMNGDFGPHSLQLIDINLDGRMDLFFYAGFEDVFSTYIFTANFRDSLSTEYDQNNYLKAYFNENDYSVLINLEGEKQPLILDSGYEGKVNRSGASCFDNHSELAVMPENSLTMTDSIKDEIVMKYKEVTGQLDSYNFDYNMPDVYPVFNTFILDPIKLIKIDGHVSRDVTSQHPEYLRWRIRILKALQQESSENCSPYIERTIKHLESYLNDSHDQQIDNDF